ncbi:MAG TPA: hypothetical protein VM470_00395 [Acidimicrobiia bacterium]|nr:hypothetical protein [Acidimicrobiia bacterium]
MSSPHLIRPFPARQLGLVEGDDAVMVFCVLGGRYAGPTMLAHLPTLQRRCSELRPEIEILVFVDESQPDAATVARIDEMLAMFRDGDALVCFQPATEAMKLVEGDEVTRGVDRTQLLAVRGIEIIRRPTLDRALSSPPPSVWVNPTTLVADLGGDIRLFPVPDKGFRSTKEAVDEVDSVVDS